MYDTLALHSLWTSSGGRKSCAGHLPTTWSGPQHDTTCSDGSLHQLIEHLSVSFESFFPTAFQGAAFETFGRVRDLLPLPSLGSFDELFESVKFIPAELARPLLDNVVSVLNHMYGHAPRPCPGKPTGLQVDVLQSMLDETDSWYQRLSTTCVQEDVEGSFLNLTGQSGNASGPLAAEKFDLLTKSGGVGPLKFVPASVKDVLSSPSALFSEAPPGLNRFPGVRKDDRTEYAILVAKQLLSQKVELASDISAGASIFPVGKKDSIKCAKYGTAHAFRLQRCGR